jgi:hypothetical protein
MLTTGHYHVWYKINHAQKKVNEEYRKTQT